MNIAEAGHIEGCQGCLGAQLRCGHSLVCSRARHRCANQYNDSLFAGLLALGTLVAVLAWRGII